LIPLGCAGQVLEDKLSQLQRGMSRIPQTGLQAVLDNKLELVGPLRIPRASLSEPLACLEETLESWAPPTLASIKF
jgi:hypothetical protein